MWGLGPAVNAVKFIFFKKSFDFRFLQLPSAGSW